MLCVDKELCGGGREGMIDGGRTVLSTSVGVAGRGPALSGAPSRVNTVHYQSPL